ncbi:hypothetical protein LguiA_031426 [Lonicera macranthoides]
MFLTQKSHFPSFSPFRRVSKPNNFYLISRSFDENLLHRLKTLCSTTNPSSINLSWLSLAVDFLSSTHSDAQTLISGLKSSFASSDDSLASYLDYSVKLLDICNSISSQIEKLRQRRLLINFVLHLLKFTADGDIPVPENLRQARESISDWEKGTSFQILDPGALIRDLASGLESAPRVKKSSVEKVIRRTIYAVGLLTVFVAGVAVSALHGLAPISKVRVPAEFLWSDSFNDLQSAIFKDMERRFLVSHGKGSFAELDDVAARVSGVRDAIDGVEVKEEELEHAVKELETVTERFSEGLDRLYNGVNEMFDKVFSTRNDVLENFRVDHEKTLK